MHLVAGRVWRKADDERQTDGGQENADGQRFGGGPGRDQPDREMSGDRRNDELRYDGLGIWREVEPGDVQGSPGDAKRGDARTRRPSSILRSTAIVSRRFISS
jgi:hypothetical protein